MIFKRIICIFAAVLTVLGCMPVSSYAFGEAAVMTEHYTPELRLSYPNGGETETVLSEWVRIEDFKAVLLENIAKTNAVVDISSFNLPQSAWINVVDFIFYNLPEAFNVYDLSGSHDGTQLLLLHLGYRDFADTPEEYNICFNKMTANADRMLAGVEDNSALSDAQKALLLHDRLCVHNEYPFYTDITDIEHTAYGALANGSSVCQGYAMAYMYLLNRVGIKNYYVSSGKLNHAWNIVYIDGVPYHVDVTFDDSNWESEDLRNVSGAVYHDNFLVSTDTLRSRNHNAYDFDSTPVDTKYENYFWYSSDTEIQLVGNKLYYIDSRNGRLMCDGNETPLADVSDGWMAGEYACWSGNFSRLSSADGELFYSLSDSIYKYTVETGECEKIYSPYLHKGFSIFGFTYKNATLIYEVNTAPAGGDYTFLKRETAPYGNIKHVIQYIEAQGPSFCYLGDSFNTGVIMVTAFYTDGTREIIEDGVSFSAFDSTSAGEKTVTVMYKEFEAKLPVTVRIPSITLDASISIKEDTSAALTAVTEPEGQHITWTSSDACVTVSDGNITGVRAGSAVVTAGFTYNGKAYSAVCKVTVDCAHRNTAVHKEIPPTAEAVGYTEGVFCNDCKKYISGHTEIPKLDLSFAPSDFMVSDGKNVRIIVGKLIAELFWSAPAGCVVKDTGGNVLNDRSFVVTGMILVLPDGSEQEIVVMGDADGDGQLSSSDARTALRAAVGLESFNAASPYFRAADVDKDNTVSASDARFLLRASVGLEDNTLWL